MIRLQNVSYSYEGCEALRAINLDISRGESVAFIGPNGSGKSTLLKLLNGIVLADTGSYVFDGKSVTRASLRDQTFARTFHKTIGFLFQNPEVQLFCPSVEEEVAFGPRQMGCTEEVIAERSEDCLKLLGIAHLAQRPPWHLSSGEKRKVAFASVLALNPDVLVLDEPMNSLDPKTKHFIKDVILSLIAAGKTILCSTHDFAYVEGLFIRGIVISSDHAIVRDDDYQKILADSAFLASQNIL